MKKFQIWALLLFSMSVTVKSENITVLFAYTTQAACAAGGPAEIKKNVDHGMKLLNDALDNNKIKGDVVAISEFVEVKLASVDSREGVDKLLDQLRQKQGPFNGIHRYRKQKKADLVCLIYSGYAMGLADLDGEFMVAHYSTFDDSYIFPHEFGHLLGCTHKGGLGGPEGGPYFEDKKKKKRRTISANGGAAIPVFSSNDKVSFEYNGHSYFNESVGDKNHNNAGTIKKNWYTKTSLGGKLKYVKESYNALPAELVDPSKAESPTCKEELITIKKCYIDSESNLNIEYDATDQVEMAAEFFDNEGQSHGGFGTSLEPGESSVWNTKGRPVYTTKLGDTYKVTIKDENFTCAIGKSTMSQTKIVTIHGFARLNLETIDELAAIKKGTVSDAQGNTYSTVITPNKIFMAERLRTIPPGMKPGTDANDYVYFTPEKAKEACRALGKGWRVLKDSESYELHKLGISIGMFGMTLENTTCSCVKDL